MTRLHPWDQYQPVNATWPFPTQTMSQLLQGADETILLLQQWVQVPPGSRLRNYRDILAKYVACKVPYQSETARVVNRAFTELSALSVIARGLAASTPSQRVRELLSLVISGQDLPDNERNTIARNTQVHLYIAAVLKASGARVEFEEPDLRVHIDGRIFGVAAKRITSGKKLEKRISEGHNQLRNARKRGIVWIEFTDAIHEFSGRFEFDNKDALSENQAALETHAYRAAEKLRDKLSKSEHLAGVVLSWLVPRTIRGSGTFETAEFMLPFSPHEPETIEDNVVRLILERVEAGLRELGQLVEDTGA